MAGKKRLGDMLIARRLINEEALNKALKLQVGGNRRLGYLLIKMGFVTEEQLQSMLSEQLGLNIVNIQDSFSPEIKTILPRYLCKKYHVIPLRLGEHNILEIAMADPSDSGAISDIEQFTEKVLQPRLASHSDIASATKKLIPWSLRDIFNPLNSQKLTALTAGIALILITVSIMQYNNDRLRNRYGTQQVTNNGIFYQNHELLLEFTKSGKVSLQGHGAHAQGSYSITFNDVKSLNKFINRKHTDFSTAQEKWIHWAVNDFPSRLH